MNETKLSSRQKKILIIITKEALSRPEINLALENIYPISKITLPQIINLHAILIAHDYSPISFRNVEDTDYLKALLLFYEKTNLFNFKKIFLEQYRFALQNYFRT